MDVETLRAVLGWCTLLGWGVLLAWWGTVAGAGDWIFGLHGRWFGLTRPAFDAIHYAGMAFLKILILVFFLFPYLALRLLV